MPAQSNTEEFILKARKVHGDKYDYSVSHYTKNINNIDILCPEHGIFSQVVKIHLKGSGCNACKRIVYWERRNKNITQDKLKQDFSHVEIPKGAKLVPLTKGKYALVDEEDYDKVMQYNWSCTSGYASSKVGPMHRFVMGVTDPKLQVDHIFHIKHDNRKSQLRVCTQEQNKQNRKPSVKSVEKFVGVHKVKSGRYTAAIRYDNKINHLGTFETAEEAARSYDKAALLNRGEFAYLNFKDYENN